MWKRLWGPGPTDAEAVREMHRQLASHWITGGLFIGRLLGDYATGLVALEAYFSGHPEVTAEYVSARLHGHYSEDTARRRLTEMVKAGKATCRKEGRTSYFSLKPDVAQAAIDFMKGEQVKLPDVV